MSEIWTIRRLLQWTTDFFRQSGIPSARLDAELLLSHALHITRLDLYLDPERPVDELERTGFREWVRLRAKRVPIAYLIGSKEFYSTAIHVEEGVLIPRPETEILVDTVLTLVSMCSDIRIAELGVGSGCITAALALKLQSACFLASDRSQDALRIADTNFVRLGIRDRVTLIESDWFDNFSPGLSGSFNVIVSNPPYIPSSILPTLAPEISRYEPSLALDGGPDGLSAYRHLIPRAREFLKLNGAIALEIGDDQGRAVSELLETAGFSGTSIVKDLSGRDRIAIGRFTV